MAVAVAIGLWLPAGGRQDAALLLPSAWLGFAVATVLATAGNGPRTLLPRAQTVAFPVSPGAEHLGALLLAPLNVAWMLPTLTLVAVSAWGFGAAPGPAAAVLLAGLAWVLTVTVVAQAAGWLVELARTTRGGTMLVRAVFAAAIVALAALLLTGRMADVLDAAPTRHLLVRAVQAGSGDLVAGVQLLLFLAAVTMTGLVLGRRCCEAVMLAPERDRTRLESRTVRPRPAARTALGAALRLDRAGVWRSPPLRRGMIALTAAPALAAVAAGLDWPMLVLLPSLAASGAGLLFGVNALALDGPGALWRESLPCPPRIMLLARILVIAEVCLVAAGLVAVLGAARAPGPPGVAAVVAVIGAVVATTAQVTGLCTLWSVRNPYPAGLRETRDQPAPPLAMARYAASLAVRTTVVAVFFSLCAEPGMAPAGAALTVAVTALGLRRIYRALHEWDEDPALRARALSTVSTPA
ncbi:hypothetical protein Kisp01_56380 [Kineosporia sp. NBRC 101677]|uniref:hypothetical protein n=1 Tax=Kineosporia sp. NBRC 101677 TaxID=3032197 RepID=UPI0024A4F434|nr:hypothetical protein [Kineosporia sp. NBRC 101677]GLY18624.1 hypothetical protein Kisp01_56380 [Kineosporia sp. NBRC 101677]